MAGAKTVRLYRELCDLLDDVAAAFAITGAQTPGWLSPYSGDVQPRKDSYERCTDPEKFLIVVARARAWTKVLVDRGWAREVPPVRWALRPLESGGADTVLEPSSDGAVPLVLTTHTPVDSAHPFNVTIAAGNPAVAMASIPDCACDGCDRGSAVLLEEFDTWVLSGRRFPRSRRHSRLLFDSNFFSRRKARGPVPRRTHSFHCGTVAPELDGTLVRVYKMSEH